MPVIIKLLPTPRGVIFSCRMIDRSESYRETRWLVLTFLAALVIHFFCVTQNWGVGFMAGHEFRQAQTAIVSYYIDQQNNFSLLYETPILGKPWVSILLEVPIYEWSVVGVSRLFDIPHVIAARTVSLLCFYLMLPAWYLLMKRLGLSHPRRLFVLAFVLTCPVYIYYSRAFLMESMVLMCCAWFLLGFVRAMDERKWSWLAVTIVAGTGAALIKSITFAVWLLPAGAYGAWLLWQDLWVRRDWRRTAQTILWGALSVGVALGALRWWINYTDPIKEAHASAYIFTSKNLSQGNWGLGNLLAGFAPSTWSILLERWREALMNPWIVASVLLAGLAFFPTFRGRVLGLAAVFFLAQIIFPFAYAYQDYYYYACAIFLSGALACVMLGALDSKLPRWVCGLLVAGTLGAQFGNYWQGYRSAQNVKSDGGFPYTAAIRDLAPKDSVIIVAGSDWAAMVPLYAQRKALMIRNGMQYDPAYLQRAFDELSDEDVFAFVNVADTRKNTELRNRIVTRFNLDDRPTFTYEHADVYCSRLYSNQVQRGILESRKYGGLTVPPRTAESLPNEPFEISAGLARSSFGLVSPAPFRAYFQYGLTVTAIGETPILLAHVESRLWLRPPAQARQIVWEFGMVEPSYVNEEARTDGMEFRITGETPDGNSRMIFSRVLDPAVQAADRGVQHETITYRPVPGEVLKFSSLPNISPNFDWGYWGKIEVK